MESNHRLPDVSQVSLPLDDGTVRVAKVGFEPTLDRLSTCSLCLLAYLAVKSREPDLNRRGTAYETVLEPDSSPPRVTVTKGRVELPWGRYPRQVLSLLRLPFRHLAISSSPDGNRTHLCSVRGCRPGPIDDRALGECVEQESNLHILRRRAGYSRPVSPVN